MLKNIFNKYNIDFINKAKKTIKFNKKIEKEEDLKHNEFTIITIENALKLGYELSQDGRTLSNDKNIIYKLEGIYIKDKEAIQIFDKEFGSNMDIINKITNKNYFFIFKKYFKKTFLDEEHIIFYNKKDLTIEKLYIKEEKIHNEEDKPALIIIDMNTNKEFKYGYFKNGKLHRENHEPAVIEYDLFKNNIKSYELCYNGEFHTEYLDKPSHYIEKNGFIKKYWHKNGKINSIKDNPALIYYKKDKKLIFDKDYDGFWIKDFIEDEEAKKIYIHYNEGKIDRKGDLPAIYSLSDSNKIIKAYYIKNHKLHRDNLKPAYIDYKNNKASFFENGLDISNIVIEWANNNNINLSNLNKKDILKYKKEIKKND